MTEEVAMFIDFENLRYGLLNNYGLEPDFNALVAKSRKYGRPTLMRAYADFSEHPSELKRQLQVAGLEAIDIPVKRSTYTVPGKPSEQRIKNAADMVLALDAVIEAIEADRANKCKIFLLVTGDRDYIKLVTVLRNRLGQRVVVCGVPGSVSGDLITAAGEDDCVEIPTRVAVNKTTLKQQISTMIQRGPAPLKYWSLRMIDQWTQDPRQKIGGTARERREAIGELVIEGVLVKRETFDDKGKPVRETILNEARARELGYL